MVLVEQFEQSRCSGRLSPLTISRFDTDVSIKNETESTYLWMTQNKLNDLATHCK